MASSSSPSLTIFTIVVVSLMITSTYATSERDHSWAVATKSAGCKGSIAECMANNNDDEEFGMESEINRRILATTDYISYGALQRNNVPCSQRGASYYNCRPGAEANPYTRGCSAITLCRS